MLIDWFTVCAQTLNFLILVWLMKRFLYKPVLNAINAREALVAKELKDANAKKTEARKERDEFQTKNDEFDRHRAELLSKATQDAGVERTRLLAEARKAADDLSAKRQQSLSSDARQLNQAISQRAQKEVFAIARKTLSDLGSASLEEQIAEVFIRRLKELDEKSKKTLVEAHKSVSDPFLVRCTFDLPAKHQTAIRLAIQQSLFPKAQIQFEISAELVGGIEMVVQGQKVAWSISNYLESLEKGVVELLNEKVETGSSEKPAVKAVVRHRSGSHPKEASAKPPARSR